MSRRALVALAVAAAVGLALAGCGGGGGGTLSKEEYGSQVAQAGETLASTFEDVAAESQALAGEDVTTGDQLTEVTSSLAETVGRGATAVEDIANELDGLDPPEDARAANDQLVDGLEKLAADMREIETALEAGDLASVLDLAGALQQIESSEAGTLIEGAIDDLRAKGYDVDGSE